MKKALPDNVLPSFYTGYVEHVRNMDLLEALTASGAEMCTLVRSLPEHKGMFSYAPGKWTVKEVLCHVMDAERIFAYRALRFARSDQTELPGFDESVYAPQANAHARTLLQLTEEMERLRSTTIDLFKSFTTEMRCRSGRANDSLISVINLGYVIAGHETHHRIILLDRYLSE